MSRIYILRRVIGLSCFQYEICFKYVKHYVIVGLLGTEVGKFETVSIY